MVRVLALAILFLLGMSAGCTETAHVAKQTDDDTLAPGEATLMSTHSFAINLIAGVGDGTSHAYNPGSTTYENYDLRAGAGALVVEGQWECTSPTCSLDIVVEQPDGQDAVRTTFTDSAHLIIQPAGGLAAGTWDVAVLPNGVVANMAGEMFVSFFGPGDLPDGFSALPSSAE